MVEEYINEEFPINTDIVQSVYDVVSRVMFEGKNPGPTISGLYGTRPFYNPESSEIVPVLFGTLFKKNIYAEVLFSKAQGNLNGKLEVKLFGQNKRRLLSLKNKISKRVDVILEGEKQNA